MGNLVGHALLQILQYLSSMWMQGVWIQWNGMMDWNSGMDWNGGIEWNVDKLDGLMGSHLLIMTTSEQRPPLNKDHPNLIVG